MVIGRVGDRAKGRVGEWVKWRSGEVEKWRKGELDESAGHPLGGMRGRGGILAT